MKKILLILALIVSGMSANAQLSQHGLVLNGGTGFIDSKNDKSSPYVREYEYKFGVSAGYLLRFKTPAPKSFHYDIGVNLGVKSWKSTTYFKNGGDYGGGGYGSGYDYGYDPNYGYGYDGYGYDYGYSDIYGNRTKWRFFTSIDGTVNYSIIKNLSVGLGVEPTYYFRYNKFDIPIVAKIAYNFKAIELGITGKYGLMNVLDAAYLKSLKLREIQMYVFIPF